MYMKVKKMNRLKKRKRIIKILKWLFILFILFVVRKPIFKGISYVRAGFDNLNYKMVSYKANMYNSLTNFNDKVNIVSKVDEYNKKNMELINIINEQKLELSKLETLQIENENFRRVLNLKNKNKFETIVAEVKLVEDLNNGIIYLSKGEKDGVKINQAVTYYGSLIGLVSKVSNDYSEVRLITNKDSKISVILNGTDLAVIRGNGNGTFSVKNYNNDIVNNDNLIFDIKTSGISDILSKDISVGTFRSVDKSYFFKTRELIFKPTYNINKIRVVLLIKK